MKLVILSLGLWLAGAQGFAAQACCSDMPSPKKASCGSCGGQSERENAPRPDCCTSMEAQKDVAIVVPNNILPENPVPIELLAEIATVNPCQQKATDLVAREASSRAESPPLYLRNSVLLI